MYFHEKCQHIIKITFTEEIPDGSDGSDLDELEWAVLAAHIDFNNQFN